MIKSTTLVCLLLFPVLAFTQQQANENLNTSLGRAKNTTDSSLIIRKFILETDTVEPDKAFELLEKSKGLLKNKTDKKLWADYHLDAGEIYFKYWEIDKAVENYIKSYDYYKSSNSTNKQLIESRFAQIYANTGYYDRAEFYLKKIYDAAIAKKDEAEMAKAETSLGRLYLTMFVEEDDNTKLEPALYYSRKAYKWIDKNGDDLTKIKLNITMANSIGFTEDGDSAYYYYYDKAIKIAETSKSIEAISKAFAYNQYARYLHDINKPDLAVEYAEKAFDIVKNSESFVKLDVAKTLYKSYLLKKEYKKATAFFEKYTELQDSLNQIEQYANINTLIHLQENPREESWIEKYWIGLLISILTVFTLIFVSIKMNQKRKLREAQNELNQLTQKVAALNLDIHHYEDEINQLKSSNDEAFIETELKETYLKDILQTPLLTDDQWLSFKQSFERVNTRYSKQIPQCFSNVSQAELRYLYLKKLGMNHKEIAAVLGISPDSVRLYKHRLGKKINPGKENILPVLFESN